MLCHAPGSGVAGARVRFKAQPLLASSKMRRAGFWALLAVALLAGCSTESPPPDPLDARPLALLSGVVFPDLRVEVSHETGHAPSPYALEEMRTALANLTDKRAIVLDGPVEFASRAPSDGAWDRPGLLRLSRELYRDGPCCPLAREGHGVLQVIYVGGTYEDVWGLHSEGVVFVFVETMRDPYPLLPPEELERNLVLHEVGHALGLVDNGVDMLQARLYPDESGSHSNNPESLMWPYVEQRDVLEVDNLTKEPWFTEPGWFDADDLADLRHFQARVREMAATDPAGLELAKRAALNP